MLNIILLALAAWRISHALADDGEAGPYGILHKLRYWAGVRYNESGPYSDSQVGLAILCVWCSSVWTGLFFAILHTLSPQFSFIISLPLALSAAIIFIEVILNKVLD